MLSDTDLRSFLAKEGERLAALAAAEKAEFISIYEVVIEYDVSLRTLRRMQAAGKMPPRVNRKRRKVYRRADIAKLFDTVSKGD